MLPIQRFFARRLYNFSVASFNNPNKDIGEFSPDPSKSIKKPRKVIDQETLDYLQKKLQAAKGKCLLDNEGYRVDVGLLISRLPIFLTFEEKEMQAQKFRLKYAKKYKILAPLPKELLEFTERPAMEGGTEGTDELPTHEIVSPDGGRITYYANSKIWSKVDPNITDNKSIQYASDYRVYLLAKDKATQQWTFPSTYMTEKSAFSLAKGNFFETVSEKKWKVVFAAHYPTCFTKRELTEAEKKSSLNKRAIGVKTFYFNCYHDSGKIYLNPQLYDDYVWVTRLNLNEYFDKTSYEKVIHGLSLV